VLVRDREDDPLVRILEDVGVIVFEQPPRDDVATLDEAHAMVRVATQRAVQQFAHPWAGCVRNRTGAYVELRAVRAAQLRVPFTTGAHCADELGTREHGRATFLGVECIQHDEPGVVDPAVGIDKAALD
jgi:hypothetical protein